MCAFPMDMWMGTFNQSPTSTQKPQTGHLDPGTISFRCARTRLLIFRAWKMCKGFLGAGFRCAWVDSYTPIYAAVWGLEGKQATHRLILTPRVSIEICARADVG